MPSREEETAERQAQWDAEFASGSTIVVGSFTLINPLFEFLQKCNYTTTTMGITEKLVQNKPYFFLSHRPDVLKAMMGDCTATRLWTNSLVIMAPEHFHRGLLNNVSALFVNFEENIGGYALLDEAQKIEWKKAIETGWNREPLPFEEELKLMKHLSYAQTVALSKLVERLEGTPFAYSNPDWTPRTAEELAKVEVGKHALERDRLVAILSGATAAVEDGDLRTSLSKLLKKIPTTDEAWTRISHGVKPVEVEVDLEEDDGEGASPAISGKSRPDTPMELDDSDGEEEATPPPRKSTKTKIATSLKDRKGKGKARSPSPEPSPPRKTKKQKTSTSSKDKKQKTSISSKDKKQKTSTSSKGKKQKTSISSKDKKGKGKAVSSSPESSPPRHANKRKKHPVIPSSSDEDEE